ncbi:hypothetical protein EV421DRAFT_261122 [Armillaria borealis]|uniref:ABM domain-containing protein n=1 Tax=Armillaria borealis TaxID=47425 RepID=A0AA39JTD5_9AGAR|nr:hypothetical protein EV421DRAFT_261122 [Armillaria borealis]
MVGCGLLVPLEPKPGKDGELADFLNTGYDLVQAEPFTLQWFALQYDTSNPTYAIFRYRSLTRKDWTKHANGKIAEALGANSEALLKEAPQLGQIKMLASKVQRGVEIIQVGLRCLLKAKPGKIDVVRNFLVNALPLIDEEEQTRIWYAFEFPGTSLFGIVDFFLSDEGRQAHIKGKVATALYAHADEYFADEPDIVKVKVLAAKIG